MQSSDLRMVGLSVFHLLARRPKSLAPLCRAVHTTFGLKYGLEKLSPSDHPDVAPAEFKWRVPLARIKHKAAIEIAGMPAATRDVRLRYLVFDVLDEIAFAAGELHETKTTTAVFAIRERAVNQLETAIIIDRVTHEKPLQGFTE